MRTEGAVFHQPSRYYLWRSRVIKILTYLTLIAIAVIMLIPFLWMIWGLSRLCGRPCSSRPHFCLRTPLSTTTEKCSPGCPCLLLPQHRHNLSDHGDHCVYCAMAGFGFSVPLRSRLFLFWLILATMMVPYPVTIVPLYIMAYRVGLVNSYTGIIAVNLSSAFGIFMMRQFCLSLPDDLLDRPGLTAAPSLASSSGSYFR